MRPKGPGQTVMAAAIVAMLLAACSGGSEGDKAGGDAAPVTLRMVTVEGTGAPYADGVAEFARQVEDLSEGSVRVDIVWSGAVEYFGAFGPGADQKVAGLVEGGARPRPHSRTCVGRARRDQPPGLAGAVPRVE